MGQEPARIRHLLVILGDQLDRQAAVWDGFDATQDRVWMAEVTAESTHVWSSKPRIAVFLTAMRHFAEDLRRDGLTLEYRDLAARANTGTLHEELDSYLHSVQPQKVVITEPGDWRVREAINNVCVDKGIQLQIRTDRHFVCDAAGFSHHARDRKQLRLEYFYRELRQRHGILMDGDRPCGGQWNYDAANRQSFGKGGPGNLPATTGFTPDALTRQTLTLVDRHFSDHPGSLAEFSWPVTRAQALAALNDFIETKLPLFGTYQDAMWTDQPWLYHARISSALNLKLLDTREVLKAAEAAYRNGSAPLTAVEGFIRQVLGWREYVRGIYWLHMPDYLERNALQAQQPLPPFYWTGECAMNCLREVIAQTLRYGYAHHIQRLMVTGLYALLLGVQPKQVHEWYLAVYVDAVEWVELPNTLGMSQYADGGVMASKPYAASGQYIKRMSNYCTGCRFNPALSVGDKACPFTTLYWDFLLRHELLLQKNQRMKFQMQNLSRLDRSHRRAVQYRAEAIRRGELDGDR